MKRLEDFIQYKCADWLRSQRIPHFHVPNAAKRNPRETSRLKAMGMVSGVHDLVILLPTCTLFVELKTTSGTISPAQERWHEHFKTVSGHRHHYLVAAATHEQAVEQLKVIVKNHS